LRFEHAAILAARGERNVALTELEALAPRVPRCRRTFARGCRPHCSLQQQLAVK